jgi:hypothetical protein
VPLVLTGNSYEEWGETEWTNAPEGSKIHKALAYACFDILPSE